MKTILFFLLPFILTAQTYRDTLILNNGRDYPCFITSINDSRVNIIYANNVDESSVLSAVKRLVIEELGTIYLNGTGFTSDREMIEQYVYNRMKKVEDEKRIKDEQVKFAVKPDKEKNDLIDEEVQPVVNNKQEVFKRWSFGVLYIPYYSGTIYRVVSGNQQYPPYSYPIESYGITINQTNMEGQISFGVMPNLRLTLDVVYTASFNEVKNEQYYRANEYSNDNVTLSTVGIKLFDFNFGVKYYFQKFLNEKVSAYVLVGFGKQIAFAEDKYKIIAPQQNPTGIVEDNIEEYTEDLNSPWHLNLGFGAEYFFNESLAMTSNIRFIYSTVTAKYDYRSIQTYETRTNKRENSISDFITRVGLGINFYF